MVLNMQATPTEVERSLPIEPRSVAMNASLSHISTLTIPASYSESASTVSRRSERVASIDDSEYGNTGISSSDNTNSTIDIGSCHSTSTTNSEELRHFWNGMYD